MAGLEQIEVHSRDYLVRWVNVKQEYTISWTILPHKKSLNFGVFKHPGPASTLHSSSTSLPPPSPNTFAADEDRPEASTTALEKLTGIGLKQIRWVGKCEADKVTQGRHDVRIGEAGNYALVFDNTFSKSLSKTATVFLLTYPTSCQPQIHFGAQQHHGQAMATAMAIAASASAPKRSPRMKAKDKESLDSLRQLSVTHSGPGSVGPPSIAAVSEGLRLDSPSIFTGVLQKRRRKKHQGYAKRFFCLDYTSSTLSYYRDRNSSALRGAIPLSLAAIAANANSREISIDSGAEIWHLKASNDADFEAWTNALQTATRLMLEATTAGDDLHVETGRGGFQDGTGPLEDQDWARLENLLSRISGTRDAVRRICLDTLAQPLPPPSPRLGSTSAGSTPIEGPTEDYFRQEDKQPFWKRKSSATYNKTNIFKRSVSAQLAVPAPGFEPVIRNGPASPQHLPNGYSRHYNQSEESMHDHCKAVLHDLDSVVGEFAVLMSESKIRRTTPPKSAVSRMSLQSIDSQEYFDAQDNNRLLNIHSDTDHEATDEGTGEDDDSVTSSDIGEDSLEVMKRRSGSVSSYLPPRAKSLVPLPLDHSISRRATIAPPTIMPPSLIGFLRKNVGKDLSTISMPVSANEPLSLLQRAAEQLEYSQLLDDANKSPDVFERLMYVSAFAVSALSNARVKERSIRKPFNPMLGETYELVREDRGFRFVAEKVSHRPVQLAFHAESSQWTFTQSPLPSQKFWGKSSEIITEGKARLILHSTGEVYSWSAATCFLRNIIAGEKYVEPVGTMTIINESSGHKAAVTFKAKGMFSGRSEEVEVQTIDSHGQERSEGLNGTWTNSLQLKEPGKLARSTVWSVGPLVENAPKHYGMTLFAAQLNETTEIEQGKLPPTDSRLRPDQVALEQGDHDQAETLKNKLEEGQRARRREMESNDETWKARWFTKVELEDEVVWKLKTGKDGYWEERARGEWTGVVPVLQI
ncbi:Oxysterol-binding protein-domain-containing protein [Exophiala viscosa]|uniref:Oxysterol-binding protein-domain-containing protein n=1 Tax=Exophiala viscosa TaxID=2486360 RepID=UPI002190AF5F|nr:Oxysterol-binding protein-domain-containing protein [Exophiala viscosa]